uniref:Uncharacterized protein n=1 Tax=Parascaris equorum TaxID=6256 RepID=A0A914RJP4_PAREQ
MSYLRGEKMLTSAFTAMQKSFVLTKGNEKILAVRPDRDATGRHYQTRARRAKLFNGESAIEEAPVGDDWSRKLPVDMRTTLMQLMNVELM